MKIYVHKNGQNFGPYALAQMRENLTAKNFNKEDLACIDGKNWIKLSEVPGIATTPEISSVKTLPPNKQSVPSTQAQEKKTVAQRLRPDTNLGKRPSLLLVFLWWC